MSFWLGLGMLVGIFAGMVLHEYAHARIAVAMGDRTPIAYGRVTLNPKAHADPLGTIILPLVFILPIMVDKPITGFLFGYAKPVPLNLRGMKDQKRAPLIVALAGPTTNFALAVAGGAILRVVTGPGVSGTDLPIFLAGFLTVNVFLGIINSLPIPPLDGSRVLGLFLSPAAMFKMEELAQYFLLFLILLFLFFGGFLSALADPVCRAASLGSLTRCAL